MTPNRPYLLRALFEWICDNNGTPYLLVDATLEGVDVPLAHVEGGRIVLNASVNAVADFDISNEAVSFNTRFSGRNTWIYVPMAAVLAIYAKETQEGMTFAPSDYPDRKERADLTEGSEEKDGSEDKEGSEEKDGSEGNADVSAGAQTPARSRAPKTYNASHLKVIK